MLPDFETCFVGKCERCFEPALFRRDGKHSTVLCKKCGTHEYGTPFVAADPEEPRKLVVR